MKRVGAGSKLVLDRHFRRLPAWDWSWECLLRRLGGWIEFNYLIARVIQSVW